MIIVRSVDEMRAARRELASDVGFVPTMGALHEGHRSLMAAARSACRSVVASIFVNPLQFGPSEDFDAYPRTEETDLEACRAEGVDVVFLPGVADMYPPGAAVTVTSGPLGSILEGADRPGHFDGVCTVVAKLFNIVTPDVAFFGQKDAQQVAVIQQMVADLSFGVRIAVCPTIREPDGLALSSRNAYLSPEQRTQATALHRALSDGAAALAAGEGTEACEKKMWEALASSRGIEPGYARAVDPRTFGPPVSGGPVLLLVAARVGSTRLIDNLLVDGEPRSTEA